MRFNPWLKRGLLSLLVSSVALGAPYATPSVSASQAASKTSQAVYGQFQQYLKHATTSSASLIQARKYLTNHIKNATPPQATLMTLQLENAQKKWWSILEDAMYAEPFQNALEDAHSAIGYEGQLTYTALVKEINVPSVRKLLQQANDLGFKMETSEGIYYPIINYEAYKRFQPFVKKDIAAYIDIMAAESNQPTTSDAALTITWDELIRRTLEKEAFLNAYPNSNRAANIKRSLYVGYLFYGSDNSPVYDWTADDEERYIDPVVKEAYEKAVQNREPGSQSVLLDAIEQILPFLDENNGQLTPEIRNIIESLYERFTEE